MTSIDELERQRAERHRLLDAEFDERIRRVAGFDMLTNQELQSLRNSGNECEAAADEIERYRTALEHIKWHMEKSGRSFVQHSTVYQITCKALGESR